MASSSASSAGRWGRLGRQAGAPPALPTWGRGRVGAGVGLGVGLGLGLRLGLGLGLGFGGRTTCYYSTRRKAYLAEVDNLLLLS